MLHMKILAKASHENIGESLSQHQNLCAQPCTNHSGEFLQHWQLTSPYISQTGFPFLVVQLALSALPCPHPWI